MVAGPCQPGARCGDEMGVVVRHCNRSLSLSSSPSVVAGTVVVVAASRRHHLLLVIVGLDAVGVCHGMRGCLDLNELERPAYHCSSYGSSETQRPPLSRRHNPSAQVPARLCTLPRASYAVSKSRCADGVTSGRRLHRCCLMRASAEDVALVKAPR